MKLRHVTILVVILLLLDQVLKIWVKTNMSLGEAITVFPDWFQLRFIENSGAAFGMQIPVIGEFSWGKFALRLLRVVLCGGIIFMISRLIRDGKTPKGVIIGLSLILAGALGNIIDNAVYGLIFSESTYTQVAHFGGSYAGFMMGDVVDMFYFPLFQWNSCPPLLDFLVDGNNYFFGAIFNLADSYISVAMVYLVIFQYKFLSK